MIHIFKAGGEWKNSKGMEYTIKAIPENKKTQYLSEGWSLSLDELEEQPKKKTTRKTKPKAE
jgi:hypothetical protein